MRKVNKEDWTPTDGLQLEANALTVAKSEHNYLVVAGPGAGKTELLAQRACYLLQTNSCVFPYRILAISFKRDAAFNLKERVRKRCGDELSLRFDSLTFDAFSKSLLDRFRSALPDQYKMPKDYEIIFSDQTILDLYRAFDETYFNTTNRNDILNFHSEPLPFSERTRPEKIRVHVWKQLIQGAKPRLTFKMIMRLAELIVKSNPKIKGHLQNSYQYIFLDEFQDTTSIQYQFFKACFLGSSNVFTAVGDDKQRIMVWAGAQETVFDDYIAECDAERLSLEMNFRSAPKLVQLQNYLVEHLLNKNEKAIPAPIWKDDDGQCYVWFFDDTQTEKEILFDEVNRWLVQGVNPREICILVKQQLARYAGGIIEHFNKNGIKARDENTLQTLLTEEISLFIISVLYATYQKGSFSQRKAAFSFLTNINSESNDKQLLKLDNALALFLKGIKAKYEAENLSNEETNSLIDEIVAFAGKDRIKSFYSAYKNTAILNEIIDHLRLEFYKCYQQCNDIVEALDLLTGKDTVPVMTVHKSKGLEYHTIIFVGLEDGAFWSFERQPDEDKCTFFVALSRAKERVVFTFSKLREDNYGRMRNQTFDAIQVIFEELQRSNIAIIEEKKLTSN